MTFQVFLSEKAQRDLDSFPDRIANQILADCTSLASNPIPDGKRIKKLQGFKEPLYRLRAGDFRVVFKRSGIRIDIVRILSKPDFQKAYSATGHDQFEASHERRTEVQGQCGQTSA